VVLQDLERQVERNLLIVGEWRRATPEPQRLDRVGGDASLDRCRA
jgi:hypothetical protein